MSRVQVLAALGAALLALALGGCAAPAAPAPTATLAPAEAVRTVTAPPAGGRFDYQIGGAYTPAAGVRIVDRDRTDPAAKGVYSVCYVNAFQTQPEEAGFWLHHPSLVLRDAAGKPLADPDWPGEHVLDISSAAKRAAIARIVDRWIDGCAAKGYRAVEPDNLDTFTRWPKRISMDDAIAYARLLATHAHAVGLAIAQKNAPDLGTKGKRLVGFDFAIAEECQVYKECDAYTDVYGRHVVEVEYTDTPRSALLAACAARGSQISVLLRDRDVVARGRAAYRAEWCS